MFYSKFTGGFYEVEIHGRSIPNDAVEITRQQHEDLMTAQSNGKVIQGDKDGWPVALDPVALTGNDLILSQIAEAEATISPRRLREAALGTDGGWLKAKDAEITALRNLLVK